MNGLPRAATGRTAIARRTGKRAKIDVSHRQRADVRHGTGDSQRRRRDFALRSARRARVGARHGLTLRRARRSHRTRHRRTTVYSRARRARPPRIIALSRHDFRVTNARPGCTRMTDDAPSRRHFACARARPRRAGDGRAAGQGRPIRAANIQFELSAVRSIPQRRLRPARGSLQGPDSTRRRFVRFLDTFPSVSSLLRLPFIYPFYPLFIRFIPISCFISAKRVLCTSTFCVTFVLLCTSCTAYLATFLSK